MNKLIKGIIATIILILIVFIGYKGINLYFYNINNYTDYNDIKEDFVIKNTVTVKHNILPEQQYVTFKEIKMKNDFEGFDVKNIDPNSQRYMMQSQNKSVTISIGSSYVARLSDKANGFKDEDKNFAKIDKEKILNKYNIKTDIDLIKTMEKNKNYKNTLFTKVSQLKENYFFSYLITSLPSTKEGITLIDGDLQGYIFNATSNMKEVNIIKDNKRYNFLFIGDNYTDDYINEFLNCLVI